MEQTRQILSKILLSIGYLIVLLFIFEFYGEFSAHAEGIFYTLGIPWRYAALTAFISFILSYKLADKMTKPMKYGLIAFFGGIGLFIAFYIVVLIGMSGVLSNLFG
ncbi:hypothetical protein JMA_03120 [Jeotgalibacillus malaysiensis]|uniref:Uncharacterized protein n=1 Tax=Jeotgalibacillus malaysiensis TaxID=1508404 RepID=A0A0B5ANP2_9BACL|nr:hypothetical protein [Jeotgalibacillus malaysiensis]AJD89629.1 hypothetical protein JMA_03120 [Jeotgalibacillus malaysiensis]